MCYGRGSIYYIWKHSKIKKKIRNPCVCHVDAGIWDIPNFSYHQCFGTIHNIERCASRLVNLTDHGLRGGPRPLSESGFGR